MMGSEELAFLDATAQAELVRKKQITPAELLEAAIERIERVNPKINAVVTPMYDQARAAASSPLPDGPFTGVPFLLKDILAAYAGVRLAYGASLLAGFVPDHDAELTHRYKKAGLVICGRTNAPEFGFLPTTESTLHGPCRNPWNLDFTAGGSSGGSAAAVAAGLVPMAHGNDGGGSIRIPASCCGVFGLKPTRARNPLGPDLGDIMSGLVCEHVLTRSVRDSAAALDATSGPDLGDPYWAPPPERPFLEEVGADPGRLRIGFTKFSEEDPVHTECIRAVEEAAALCADLGHRVEEKTLDIPNDQFGEAFAILYACNLLSTLTVIEKAIGKPLETEQMESPCWFMYQLGKKYTGADYLNAVGDIQRISRQVARQMLDYDVLLTPVLAKPPLPLGSFDSTPEDPLKALAVTTEWVLFTQLCNATGLPAMSVPLYWTDDNLPVGVQFIGQFGDEATLFRLAAQLEEARPWSDRRPPVSA
jgi:amidase